MPVDLPADAPNFQYNHLGSLAYIGADRGVWDVGRKMPIEYGEIGPVRGWLMGLTVRPPIHISRRTLIQRDFEERLDLMQI